MCDLVSRGCDRMLGWLGHSELLEALDCRQVLLHCNTTLSVRILELRRRLVEAPVRVCRRALGRALLFVSLTQLSVEGRDEGLVASEPPWRFFPAQRLDIPLHVHERIDSGVKSFAIRLEPTYVLL